MKLLVPIIFVVLVTHQTIGQPVQPDTSYKLPCDCTILKSGSRGFLPSEKEARKVVINFLNLVRQHSSLKYNDTIAVKAAGCGPPEARNCITRLPNEQLVDIPLILYNNEFLYGINKNFVSITLVDRHILAHEIGHHVFGHLKNTDGEAVFSDLYGTDAVSKYRIARRYKVSNRHAEEIQADFFGLWLLSLTEKKLDFDAFVLEFNTDYIRKYIESAANYSSSHPLFKDRIKAMERFWNQLQIRNLQGKGVSRKYFSSAASAAYIELHPERAFWNLGLTAGLTIAGKPAFTVSGQSVDALLYPLPKAYNLYAGLYVSRFRWNKPWRYEAEVAYTAQTYGTLIGDKDSQRLLETLELRYLTAFPKITWSPLGRSSTKFASHRFGFFASAGPILRLPLRIDYQNHATMVAPANQPSLQLSIGPRVSIGVELLKKSFLPRGYKLALNYELEHIRLATNPRPILLAHNLDITFHCPIARW